MKIYRMIAAAALITGLSACNKEMDELHIGGDIPENAVQITASVGSPFATRSMPVGSEAEQKKFSNGDEILVEALDDNYAIQGEITYRFDGIKWTPKEGKYLLWQANIKHFVARYPAAFWASLKTNWDLQMPTDQSSLEKLSGADIMTKNLYDQQKSSTPLNFEMKRLTNRLIIRVAGFNPEFAEGSKVEELKVITEDTSNPSKEYLPYAMGEGGKGSSYTVLLPNHGFNELKVTLKVNGKAMIAKLSKLGNGGKSYTINLTVGKEKLEVGEVIVSDWGTTTTLPGGEAQEKPLITNPVLVDVLKGLGVVADADGTIDLDKPATKTALDKITDISVDNKQLTSLENLPAYLPKLNAFYCNQNQLTTLDVSKNTVLTRLDCSSNQLTTLDVSKNTMLTSLVCPNNQLTTLDMSQNAKLTALDCGGNQLSTLDVSQNAKLTGLACSGNQLSTLDVSHNPELKTLMCSENRLSTLDVSQNAKLTGLYCFSNQLTTLNVSHNPELTDLDCYKNQLTTLDMSKNTKLEYLHCFSNQLTTLDVSHNPELKTLMCSSNRLSILDISKNLKLETVECYGQKDASGNPRIITVKLTRAQKDAGIVKNIDETVVLEVVPRS